MERKKIVEKVKEKKVFPQEKIFDKVHDIDMKLASRIEKVMFAAHN